MINDFDVLINKAFIDLDVNSLSIVNNKHLLSIVNDFEGGVWRYNKFQNYIWDNIAETALSKSERDKLIDKSHTMLVSAAKKLRIVVNDPGRGSELCEILLYGIMKDHYSALPVVPKIFYKQNPQDNAKGADSVHIVVEGDDDFSLWFGEAKFYKDISGAMRDAITSLNNFFSGDQIRKENSIITNIQDIHNLHLSKSLIEKIKGLLNENTSLDELKPRIHIPILLLYECEITKRNNELTQDYKNKIIDSHKNNANKYFKKQIKEISNIFKYANISFHLILFPVPDKQKIVDSFISNVSNYQEQ